tara:strand:+ start:736 stop:966 length:231 start_codon:yes stop_codon:yes gene_type:complete
MTRGINNSFFRFRIREIDTQGNLLETQYFKTYKEICEKYNCCRGSIYRIIKNPLAKTTLPFKVERVHIHTSAIDYI